jgi:hypothetical protein
MATCTPLFRVRTGVIAIYELPPINWWRPRKSHPPDVLIASEVATLSSPDPQIGCGGRIRTSMNGFKARGPAC